VKKRQRAAAVQNLAESNPAGFQVRSQFLLKHYKIKKAAMPEHRRFLNQSAYQNL
jgi:hypothetical protein